MLLAGNCTSPGFEPPTGPANQSGECRTLKIDTIAGEDLRLPVERGMVAIFADQHLRQQRRRCQAAGDGPLRSGRLHHRLASPASIFWSRRLDHAQLRRYPVQHLAHALADGMQRAAGSRERGAGEAMAWQSKERGCLNTVGRGVIVSAASPAPETLLVSGSAASGVGKVRADVQVTRREGAWRAQLD